MNLLDHHNEVHQTTYHSASSSEPSKVDFFAIDPSSNSSKSQTQQEKTHEKHDLL